MNDVAFHGGGGAVLKASNLLLGSPGPNGSGRLGTFEGYASLFGVEDMGRDVVEAGAFSTSLAKRGASGIKMLFQHDTASPIGVWETIRQDARGLYVSGRLVLEVEKAAEVLALMKAGAIDGLSIGFRVATARRDPRSGVRRLTAVDLWEISVVTFPMLPGARVSNVKASVGFRSRACSR